MSLYTDRTARKRKRCERCAGWIEKGTRYTRAALPPWVDPNESAHWWTLNLHGRNYDDCLPEQVAA